MDGFFTTSALLVKRLKFLKKYTKNLSVKPTQIYNNKFFLEMPVFTNKTFSINSRVLYQLSKKDFEFKLLNNCLERKVRSNSYSILEKIQTDEIENHTLNVDEPLMSFDCPYDLVKFILKLESKSVVELKIHGSGRVECNINDLAQYKFVMKKCKIQISNVDSIEVRIKASEVSFLESLLDNTIVFCIFEDFLLIYCYDQESTIAVQIDILI